MSARIVGGLAVGIIGAVSLALVSMHAAHDTSEHELEVQAENARAMAIQAVQDGRTDAARAREQVAQESAREAAKLESYLQTSSGRELERLRQEDLAAMQRPL